MSKHDQDVADPARRGFVLATGGGLVAAGLGALPVAASGADADFSRVADVVVVGSGAAGFSAALFAREAGADVLVLEKGPVAGGTTLRSGGVHYIPNNRFLRAAGVAEARTGASAHHSQVFQGVADALGASVRTRARTRWPSISSTWVVSSSSGRVGRVSRSR